MSDHHPNKPFHHGDLPSAVVHAAVVLIEKDGIGGLGFQALARATGVSHTAIYRHFANKDAVLVAVAEAGFARLGATFEDAVATAPRSDRRAFLHIGAAVVEFAVHHPVYFRTMFAGPLRLDLAELSGAPSDTPFGQLLALVRRFQASGTLRRGPAMHLAMTIWATTHGLATLAVQGHLPADPAPRRVVVDRVHRALLDGIAAR